MNPEARLKGLETFSPFPLKLLAVVPHALIPEKEVHARFARWRLRGEWFDSRTEFADFIENAVQMFRNDDRLDWTVARFVYEAGVGR